MTGQCLISVLQEFLGRNQSRWISQHCLKSRMRTGKASLDLYMEFLDQVWFIAFLGGQIALFDRSNLFAIYHYYSYHKGRQR